MQEAVKKKIEGLAFDVALGMFVSNGVPGSRAEFDALLDVVGGELTRVVETLEAGKIGNVPTKPKKAPRKSAEPKAATGGKRSGIEPEALKAFIGKSQEGAASLQQIAENFGVSKGVAKRAVEALGSAVKSATGPAVAGKRGKAPTVFWVE